MARWMRTGRSSCIVLFIWIRVFEITTFFYFILWTEQILVGAQSSADELLGKIQRSPSSFFLIFWKFFLNPHHGKWHFSVSCFYSWTFIATAFRSVCPPARLASGWTNPPSRLHCCGLGRRLFFWHTAVLLVLLAPARGSRHLLSANLFVPRGRAWQPWYWQDYIRQRW